MQRRRAWVVLAVLLALLPEMTSRAGGVFMVTRKGVEAYADAKNSFLQGAYSNQLPGLNPKATELTGAAGDDALLQEIRDQNPDLVFTVGAYATKKVRQAMPGVWILYCMVYFPEVDQFPQDQKMVGVISLGPTRDLATMLKSLTKGKSLQILHSDAVAASIPDLVSRLKADGIEARGLSVAGQADLGGALTAIRAQTSVVLLLPDPITANPDSLRFIITQCLSSGLLPITLSDEVVANGALCGAYYAASEIGSQASRLAKDILAGKIPSSRLVAPAKSSVSCNRGTAEGLKLKFPKEFHPETMYE